MTEAKDYYRAQKRFYSWIEREFSNQAYSCQYQVYDHKHGVLIEKWKLGDKLYLVELYADGGFQEYKICE